MALDNYRSNYTFAMDFGTSDFKYGPISCGENPRIVNNRGYFPDTKSVMYKAFESTSDIIVGEDVPLYLQSSEDLSSRLVYPMRNGMIDKGDDNAWRSQRSLPLRIGRLQRETERWLSGILRGSIPLLSFTQIHVRAPDGHFQKPQ